MPMPGQRARFNAGPQLGAKIMKRLKQFLVAMILVMGVTGCVEVIQLVKMQHDGSGLMTETITIKPRAL